MNRKELIAAVAGKAGVAEADTDKVLAGTAAIFVGRTTTTGATNPSSHRCPAASRQAPFGRTHRSPRVSPALDCGDEHKTPHPAAPAEPNIPAGPTPAPAPARLPACLPQRRSSAWLATVAMA